jgi:quinol monooxygenase YgiN
MYLAIVKLKPRFGKKQEMLELLGLVEDQSHLICRYIDGGVFVQNLDNEVAILYLEQWESKEDLYLHIQSPLYLWLLAAMELASEPPEVHFHEIADSQGLELVETLREGKSQSSQGFTM